MKSDVLERALTELEKAQAKVNEVMRMIRRFPEEPEVGTVLTFDKTYPGGWASKYTYAALRAPNGYWYLSSGYQGGGRHTWEELVETIGDSPCRIAAAFEEVPA
jgi:hypothetical protein